MRNICLLLKNYLVCGIGSLRRKNSRAKTVVGIISVAILYAIFFSLILFFMLFIARSSQPTAETINAGLDTSGLINSVLAMGFVMSVFIALVMAVQKITGGQKANDTELLLSMPLKKIEIIIAKALSNYIFNLAFVVLFFLPSIIAYLVYTPFNVITVCGCFSVLLLIPLAAVGLSSLIDFLVTVCFSNSKFGNISKAVFTLLTLFGVVTVYEFFSLNLENPTIMSHLVNWIITFNPVVMIPFFCGAIFLFLMGAWLNSLLLNRENRVTQFKSINISRKITTPLKALLKNETNRYFNSPALMINTLLGPLAIVALTIWLLIDKGNTFINLAVMFGISENATYIVYGLIFAGFTVLTYPSAVSISLEGKQLWILRSMPIPAHTILSAKACFNMILLIPLTLAAGIILSIVLKISIFNFIIMMAIPLLTAILISYSGVLLNLFFPKFEYENENTLIKQSTSAVILLFVGMLFIIVLSVLTIWLLFQLSVIITACIVIALLVALACIAVILTYTTGQRIFNRL